jgi:hypothetical protein
MVGGGWMGGWVVLVDGWLGGFGGWWLVVGAGTAGDLCLGAGCCLVARSGEMKSVVWDAGTRYC